MPVDPRNNVPVAAKPAAPMAAPLESPPVRRAAGEIAGRLATPDPALTRAQLKKELKLWEARFRAEHGRDATPQDILTVPDVARKYKRYEKYKKLSMRMSAPTAKRLPCSSAQEKAGTDLAGVAESSLATPKKQTSEPVTKEEERPSTLTTAEAADAGRMLFVASPVPKVRLAMTPTAKSTSAAKTPGWSPFADLATPTKAGRQTVRISPRNCGSMGPPPTTPGGRAPLARRLQMCTEPDEIGPSPARSVGGLFGAVTPSKVDRPVGTPRRVHFGSISAYQNFASPSTTRSRVAPLTTPAKCGEALEFGTADVRQAQPADPAANPFLVQERVMAPWTPGKTGPDSGAHPSPGRTGVGTPRRTPRRTRRTFAMLFGMDEEEVNNLGFSISSAKSSLFSARSGLPSRSNNPFAGAEEDEEDVIVPANFHFVAPSRASSRPPPEPELETVEGEEEEEGDEDEDWEEEELDGDQWLDDWEEAFLIEDANETEAAESLAPPNSAEQVDAKPHRGTSGTDENQCPAVHNVNHTVEELEEEYHDDEGGLFPADYVHQQPGLPAEDPRYVRKRPLQPRSTRRTKIVPIGPARPMAKQNEPAKAGSKLAGAAGRGCKRSADEPLPEAKRRKKGNEAAKAVSKPAVAAGRGCKCSAEKPLPEAKRRKKAVGTVDVGRQVSENFVALKLQRGPKPGSRKFGRRGR